ncbi:thioredoxin-disulfide reductase [Clostridium fallax]|uniref:Thioredoxin reductase n=1 Tax=Clostridium fallax TaxID=1533 RepID=A0A1M4SPW6_9CLOT|nr:thioredoxin-disulfide reductase [Clostridium fallax]SHE34293.1 thioredoxin reductase (NADPH) [Clostridium fallax]SQB07924.1 thioredoxin-disulfide reductase [Clostridium fallax]
MSHVYDTVIIGGGPAGLSAALYASRGKLDTLLIERAKFGGQVATTADLENYPGSITDCTGPALIARMKEQAEDFGTKFEKDEITDVQLEGEIKTIKGKKGEYQAKTVIIATGAYPRLGGFKNEIELRGKGISYCATCDADFFTDLDIAVVGGGDSALTEALYLTKFGESVTIIHRRDEFRGAKSLVERVKENPKIKLILDSVVEEAVGDEILEKLIIKNVKTNELSELEVNGCFVFVGYLPISELFKGKIDMTERGDIVTDEDMRTNIPGVFAAGDVRKKTLRQVVTAASDGAQAATAAEAYLSE